MNEREVRGVRRACVIQNGRIRFDPGEIPVTKQKLREGVHGLDGCRSGLARRADWVHMCVMHNFAVTRAKLGCPDPDALFQVPGTTNVW